MEHIPDMHEYLMYVNIRCKNRVGKYKQWSCPDIIFTIYCVKGGICFKSRSRNRNWIHFHLTDIEILINTLVWPRGKT